MTSVPEASLPDPTRRFSNRVADYVRYRPDYPAEAVAFIAWRCGLGAGSMVADIGSGTGILTRHLLDLGCTVVGVEPNREMREAAEGLLADTGDFGSAEGRAEETGLADAWADAVTAGQAFHWFDAAAARREFVRILRPRGWVALVWNVRRTDTTPFLRGYEALLRARVPDYLKSPQHHVDRQALADFFAPGGVETYTCRNEQRMDLPALRGRLLSSSYAPKEGQAGHEELMAELGDLFRVHEREGRVCLEYRSPLGAIGENDMTARTTKREGFAIRGVMLDPARLIESRKVYRDLIPMLGEWGYNTLFWHFTADQGCALRFPSHPELGSLHAYEPEEMRDLIALARRHGLTVVPEVECFGHTNFITNHKKYAHLRDGAEGKPFSAMCVFHDEAKAVLSDLFADTAAIFDAPYVHAGLDEVGFGDHPISKKLLRKRHKHELFGDHINWVHGELASRGKRMMMWGDHLAPPPTGDAFAESLDRDAFSDTILDAIPRDIVICDWHYNPKPPTDMLDRFLARGFDAVACPATMAYGSVGHPRNANLDSLRDFSREAWRRRSQPGMLGVMNTVWCPYRDFPGAVAYAIALGAAYQQTGGVKPRGFDAAFVKRVFGISRTEGVEEALKLLHASAPHVLLQRKCMPVEGPSKDAPTDAELKSLERSESGALKALDLLERAGVRVKRGKDYYDDLLFAAEYAATISGRSDRLEACREILRVAQAVERAGGRTLARQAMGKVRAALRAEAQSARRLRAAGVRRWARSRFADDPKRDGIAPEASMGFDAVTQQLRYAVETLDRLVAEPTLLG